MIRNWSSGDEMDIEMLGLPNRSAEERLWIAQGVGLIENNALPDKRHHGDVDTSLRPCCTLYLADFESGS